jgi:hypothetical protein
VEPSLLPHGPGSGQRDRRLHVRGAFRVPVWFTQGLDGEPGWAMCEPTSASRSAPRANGRVDSGFRVTDGGSPISPWAQSGARSGAQSVAQSGAQSRVGESRAPFFGQSRMLTGSDLTAPQRQSPGMDAGSQTRKLPAPARLTASCPQEPHSQKPHTPGRLCRLRRTRTSQATTAPHSRGNRPRRWRRR